MIITDELIVSGQSAAGGWNREQFELMGIAWPPRRGWKRLVIGQEIDDTDACRFVLLKGIFSKDDREAIIKSPHPELLGHMGLF